MSYRPYPNRDRALRQLGRLSGQRVTVRLDNSRATFTPTRPLKPLYPEGEYQLSTR